MSFFDLFGGIIIVAIASIIFSSMIVLTKNKTVSIIETFRKYSATKQPGLSFKLPWPFQVVSNIVPMNIQHISTTLELKTNDNLFIKYPINVQYKVLDPVKATYELEDSKTQILSYIGNLVRSEIGKKTFLELYSFKDELQEAIRKDLSVKIESFGFEIEAILVDEPIPPQAVQDSYNSVTASEREKEAAKNKAEAARIALVAEAEAQKESKKLQGEGIAAQRTAITEGFKDSIEKLSSSLGVSNELALTMILQLNKFDTLRDVAQSKGSLIVTDGSSSSESKELISALTAFKAVEKTNK